MKCNFKPNEKAIEIGIYNFIEFKCWLCANKDTCVSNLIDECNNNVISGNKTLVIENIKFANKIWSGLNSDDQAGFRIEKLLNNLIMQGY